MNVSCFRAHRKYKLKVKEKRSKRYTHPTLYYYSADSSQFLLAFKIISPPQFTYRLPEEIGASYFHSRK